MNSENILKDEQAKKVNFDILKSNFFLTKMLQLITKKNHLKL